MTARRHPEDDLQRQVARFLDSQGWLWCHVPNGGKRGKVEAARLKGLGVKAGVPDILIFEEWQTSDHWGFGVAIELKALGARGPSKVQRKWLDELSARGWLCDVCRSLGDVMEICETIEH